MRLRAAAALLIARRRLDFGLKQFGVQPLQHTSTPHGPTKSPGRQTHAEALPPPAPDGTSIAHPAPRTDHVELLTRLRMTEHCSAWPYRRLIKRVEPPPDKSTNRASISGSR